MNPGECLISRRNRPSTRKRSLSPVSDGCFVKSVDASNCTQPAHKEKCCKRVSMGESDLNNSDIWLAEVAMPLEAMEMPHDGGTTLEERQEKLHSISKERAPNMFSRNVSNGLDGSEAAGQVKSRQCLAVSNHFQKMNGVLSNVYLNSVSQSSFNRKVSSPVREKADLNSFQEQPSDTEHKDTATNHSDSVNFSGDADLFDDSLTEHILKNKIGSGEISECLQTGIHKQFINDHIDAQDGSCEDVQNQDDHHRSCDILYPQTHDSCWSHTELLNSHAVSVPDCDDYQGFESATKVPSRVTLVKQTNANTSPLQMAQIATPRLKTNTETLPVQPSKTSTPKALGSCLKDRLKNKLLQNACKGSPSANNLEELRKEGVAKALMEASQIRREGMVDGLGPFYGLPNKVQELLTANRKITKLYDWQDECLRLPALYAGKNLIYTLPTSGGKTLVAEILIMQQLLCKQKNALLILPYISIVQEKVRILSEFAVELGFLVEEYAGSKGRFPPTKRRQKQSLFVATIEKGQSLVNSLLEAGRLGEVGLVVVDELHMIGEGGSRGSAMESCLLKLLNAIQDPPQIIGMSATLNNIKDLAKFLGAEVFTSDFRPVSLTEYVKVEDNLYLVDNKALVPEDKLQHDKILTFSQTEESQQTDPDHLLHLVLEILPDNSCLLFCPTKRYCENVALMLAKMMCKQHRHLADVHKEKRKALLRELHNDGGGKMCPTLKYTFHFGLAYHHSGLTTDERRLIEDAYSDGVLCLLTCTSTLAAGVNLPAKRVILRSPYVGADFIKHSQYKQMTGRAGRAGIDASGESILIAKKVDMPKVVELLSGPQDVCHSSLMYQSGKGLRSLILSLIGLKVVETTQRVYTVVQRTLLTIQAAQLGIDVVTVIQQTLQDLIDSGLVVQKNVQDTQSENPGDLLQIAENTNTSEENTGVSQKPDSKEKDEISQGSDSQDLFEDGGCWRTKPKGKEDAAGLGPVEVLQPPQGPRCADDICQNISDSPSDFKLEVTELGKATFKGSVDVEFGSRLYEDLERGKQSLVLTSHLHLLFLVTPYDMARDVTPCWMTYLHQLGTLAADEMKVSSLIGITESFIVRKASGRSTRQTVDMLVVQRFYLTLMLHELWQQFTVWEVAERFQQTRGFVQNLLSSAASFASCVLRFCQELPEFWAYQDLLVNFGQRLTYCVTMELMPLMEVPGVKMGRARQLYAAGYQTLQSLAAAKPAQLVSKIQFLTRKAARQIVSAAKVILEEKTDALLEQVEQLVPLPLPLPQPQPQPSAPQPPVHTEDVS